MTEQTMEPLAKHTTFRIGGPADYYLIPESRHDDDGDFRVHGLHMIKKLHPRHIVHTNVA